MPHYDPSSRARLVRLLEAGEALRAAAEAYGEALDDAPVPSEGLSVAVVSYDGDLQVLADASKKHLALLHAEFLHDLVERLTGVVDDAARKNLAEAERAALATYDKAKPDEPPTPTKRGRR